jgi:hypothetical protein
MTDLLARLLNAPLRVQRLLAWGLLAFLCLAGSLFLLLGVSAYENRMQSLAARRADLGRLQALLHVRDHLTRLSDGGVTDLDSYLQKGQSPTIAAARLQTWLAGLAQEAGISLGSVNPLLPDPARGASRRVGLDVELSGPWATIVNLLSRIETARPMLVVTRLAIRSNGGGDQTAMEQFLHARISFEGVLDQAAEATVRQP